MINERKVFSNGYTRITAEDIPTPGGAPVWYHIVPESASGEAFPDLLNISFQTQPLEKGVNGVTNEDLLAVMIDRLKCFQKGPGACKENEEALGLLKAALVVFNSRAARMREGKS